MKAQVVEATAQGATLVAFPELAYFAGKRREWLPLMAQYDTLVEIFRHWAREHHIYLVPGTLREPVPGEPEKFFNTLLVFDPQGQEVGHYRKLFLFKATLAELSYDESRYSVAGDTIAVAPVLGTQMGLSICFDLRFPELFRSLKKKGCAITCLPTSFTVTTGKVHWEALTRARAIENSSFLIAPCQVGRLGDGEEKYGHSCIISPWGEMLVDLKDKPAIGYAELDLSQVTEAEAKLNAWAARRETLFPIT